MALFVPKFQSYFNRLSVILHNQGFREGDIVHIVAGNHNLYHPLILAVWRLGGIVSCIDIALNADTIKYQVGIMSKSIFIFDTNNSSLYLIFD